MMIDPVIGPVIAPAVFVIEKPAGPVPVRAVLPLVCAVNVMPLPALSKPAVAVRADAAAAGAAIAAAITGTVHAAPFMTARRSNPVFGAARLLISDIYYPKF